MRRPLICTICTYVVLATQQSIAAEFIPLGFLDENDPTSRVFELSGDGSTVIGVSPFFGPSGFRWTRETGMTEFPHVPGFPVVFAHEISHDGETVFGMNRFNVGNGTFDHTLFRWTEENGIVNLGNPTSDFGSPLGFGATTPDGRASAGDNNGTGEAYRWKEGEGFTRLGNLAVQAISDDGHVVAGTAGENNLEYSFRWTEELGIVNISPGFGEARVNGISSDGNAVLGGVGNDIGSLQPFVWKVGDELQILVGQRHFGPC